MEPVYYFLSSSFVLLRTFTYLLLDLALCLLLGSITSFDSKEFCFLRVWSLNVGLKFLLSLAKDDPLDRWFIKLLELVFFLWFIYYVMFLLVPILPTLKILLNIESLEFLRDLELLSFIWMMWLILCLSALARFYRIWFEYLGRCMQIEDWL